MATDQPDEKPAISPKMPDFPELIAQVQHLIGTLIGNQIPGTSAQAIDDARQEFESVLEKAEPLPTALQALASRAGGTFDRMKAMAARRELSPEGTYRLIDPTVHLLLWMNYEFAKTVTDPRTVAGEFRRVVNDLTSRPKGRPPAFSIRRLQEAKRLREQGWSYGKIAKKLGFPSDRHVRLALSHHFPPKKK